jgi:hypothetical protein
MLPGRLAALCVPIAALALPPLASAAPLKDRVIERVSARAAQAPTSYPTGDGTMIRVVAADPAVAQRYATFVGTLPHGAELAQLRIVVVAAADVGAACGSREDDGTVACYGANDKTMIVPDATPEGTDYSVEYVIAHEYGHHIAAHRSNAPLPALDYGPKRWASYELVCVNSMRGRLAPGDEGDDYLANPGEAWAEAYARLVFPNEAWRFTSLLRPTRGALLAAMADVTQPWTRRSVATFSGSGTQAFRFPLTLDGAFTIKLKAPRGTKYDLILRAGTDEVERSSNGRIHFRIACRDRRTEKLTIKVQRRSGPAVPYSLEARYAG